MTNSNELQAVWAEMLSECEGDIDCAADAMHSSGYSEEEIESVARPAAGAERDEAAAVASEAAPSGQAPVFRPFVESD